MGVERVAWSVWRESRRIGAIGATALCTASPSVAAAAAAAGGSGGLDLFCTKSLTQLSSKLKCCLGPPVSGRTASVWTWFLKQSSSFDSEVSSPSIFRVQSTSSCRIFNNTLDLSYSVFGSKKKYGNIYAFHSQCPFGFRTFGTSAIMAAAAGAPTTTGSLVRQNFHEECEGKINRQINMELYASYVYMSMAYYFDRDDVAFPGLHKYFKKASDEEREHAEKFMKYQNERGGRIALQPIAQPNKDEWESPMTAVTAALELEKTVNATLLDLHAVAGSHNDPQLCDFLETHFLEEQVKAIKELSGYITQLKRCGPGLGEYIFDKELNE